MGEMTSGWTPLRGEGGGVAEELLSKMSPDGNGLTSLHVFNQ